MCEFGIYYTQDVTPHTPAIEEEEDKLFSFLHMAEALHNVHKPPICVQPKPIKSCLKTINIDSEPKGCSLASTICSIFPFQKMFSCKTPQDYLNMSILSSRQ